ncbi:MAG: hypothetical protein DRO11_03220 [Methanobacteriota archaeon]|nr:MAG: hypothetical protein DRO11_03220 [Euryarchaeota archaeon]
MKPGEFLVRYTSLLLRIQGFSVTTGKIVGRHRVDLIAFDPFEELEYIYKCSEYYGTKLVSLDEVRQLKEQWDDVGANRAVYITTTGYTPYAKAFCGRVGITTIDGKQLDEWEERVLRRLVKEHQANWIKLDVEEYDLRNSVRRIQ